MKSLSWINCYTGLKGVIASIRYLKILWSNASHSDKPPNISIISTDFVHEILYNMTPSSSNSALKNFCSRWIRGITEVESRSSPPELTSLSFLHREDVRMCRGQSRIHRRTASYRGSTAGRNFRVLDTLWNFLYRWVCGTLVVGIRFATAAMRRSISA